MDDYRWQLAEHSLQTQCKCHGVSGKIIQFKNVNFIFLKTLLIIGSCQVKTCWRSLPSVAEIANRMKVREIVFFYKLFCSFIKNRFF